MIFYHQTFKTNVDSILKFGLLVSKSNFSKNKSAPYWPETGVIFLSKEPYYRIPLGKFFTFEVNLNDDFNIEKYVLGTSKRIATENYETYEYQSYQDIPKECLRLLPHEEYLKLIKKEYEKFQQFMKDKNEKHNM